ncbi:MAG: hypothetical protein NC332_01665 [Firmicutes bacterium]|nr:hypothetical protein [Bacillota bacterium]
MVDYLEIFEKFKDVKDIGDYIDDTRKLRLYFGTRQFVEMQNHIIELTRKYSVETIVWNAVNTEKPTTYQQAYINAENFLCAQGVKLIAEKISNYKKYLTQEEIAFIEKMIEPME